MSNQPRDEVSRIFSLPIEVAKREYMWELLLLVLAVLVSLVGLLSRIISDDAGTRVVAVFSVNLVLLAFLLNLHYQRYKRLLTEKTDKVDERVGAFLKGYKAIRVILESQDSLFKEMATHAIEEQFSQIENAEIEYVISRFPRLLKTSIEQAIKKQIDAVYYVDELAHAKFWDSRIMENYFRDTARAAKKNKVKFRRLFVLSPEKLSDDPEFWITIYRVMGAQEAAGIRTFATCADRYLSGLAEKADLVVIKGVRVHQHARKGSEGFRYTTALMITSYAKVQRIEQLVESAFAESIQFMSDPQVMLEKIIAQG